jgi:hypothetical protein
MITVMKYMSFTGFLLGLVLAGISITSIVHAQTPSLIPVSGCIDNDGNPIACPAPAAATGCNFNTGIFQSECIPAYLAYIIGVLFKLTGAIFLLMLILGGYQYVIGKAGGGGGEEGKARVRFAIIGFLVTALSFYIVDFVLGSI